MRRWPLKIKVGVYAALLTMLTLVTGAAALLTVISFHNLFAGTVKEIAYFGSYNTYLLTASDGTLVRVTESNTSRHDHSGITWGDAVFFWWGDDAGVVLRD